MNTCQQCGKPAPKKHPNQPWPKYCGTLCRGRAQAARMREDGRYEALLAAQRERTRQNPKLHPHACQVCQENFTSRYKVAKYCSSLCSSRAFNARRRADGRLSEQVRKHADKRAATMSAWRERQRHTVPCTACGKPVERGWQARHSRTACSGQCRSYLARGTWPSTAVPDRHPSRSTAIPKDHPARRTPSRPRFLAGQCMRCGAAYISDRMAGNSLADRYCSVKCGVSQARARRRARRRSAFVAEVSPVAIYQRDGWRCRLCDKKLKRNAVVPHPLAPTIDHIIPLAQGGTHEPANVQAAHFLCNSRKGDRAAGDQLALLG